MYVIVVLLATFITSYGQNQYPFEQYPEIHYKEYSGWKTHQSAKGKVQFSLVVPHFFNNQDSLTILLTSFELKFDSSFIRIFRNNLQIQEAFEPVFFIETNVSTEPLQIGDINGDTLNDIKLNFPYMGNGLASLNQRVIYLFQKEDETFTKISFLDKMGKHSTERDFNGDHNFEIITMRLNDYKEHNYWTFNVYNFKNNNLININDKFDYPIMIQFLYRDNYTITNKISRVKMKDFTDKVPIDFSRE